MSGGITLVLYLGLYRMRVLPSEQLANIFVRKQVDVCICMSECMCARSSGGGGCRGDEEVMNSNQPG